jgi:hypothetical protein
MTQNRLRTALATLMGTATLSGCTIDVLQSRNDFTEAQVEAAAALPSVARGATKAGVSGIYAMWTVVSMVTPAEAVAPGIGALLEVQTQGFANQLNARNRAAGNRSYEALNLAETVLAQVEAIPLSTNAVADQKGKALLRGNMWFVQGMIYGNLARYYTRVVEHGTKASLTPEQARAKSIALLERARGAFRDLNAQPATPAVPFTTTGLITTGDDKLINSVVGMFQFDAGNTAAAAPLLDGGYVAADAARQATFRQDPNGDFIGHDMWTDFSSGGLRYSPDFIALRLPGDSLRVAGTTAATNPRNWFANNNFEYFWPVVANVPFISWQEVAMMRAQLTTDATARAALVTSVLSSLGMSAADVARVVGDAAFTNARIARYVYLGKGRAPISGTAGFRRWEVPDELTR